MTEFQLLWLLLPVAAISGWYIGRRESARRRDAGRADLPSQYFRGLNYLLSEEPDKAIEVFTRLVEVDSDTVETHLALGNLFRRRGEVDRAIRIHQNLIARPSLNRDQRAYALLELGEDYLRAGLLDRAESLFEQVIQLERYVDQALRQLLQVYQQEREWGKATATAHKLRTRGEAGMDALVAQYGCELAEQALVQGDSARARQLVKRALQDDPACVRASLALAQLEQAEGNHKAALKALQKVEQQDAEFLPEILAPMRQSYRALGQQRPFVAYLRERLEQPDVGAAATLALADLVEEERGQQAAVGFIAEQLRRHPSIRGLDRLLALELKGADGARRRDVEILKELIGGLLRQRPAYECRHCGFTARSLHWQCPSCRRWACVKPVRGNA